MSTAGGIDIYDQRGGIRCEVDGERTAGAHLVRTMPNSDGEMVIAIITDQIIAAHLASDTRPHAPRMVLSLQGEGIKNNHNVTGRGHRDA